MNQSRFLFVHLELGDEQMSSPGAGPPPESTDARDLDSPWTSPWRPPVRAPPLIEHPQAHNGLHVGHMTGSKMAVCKRFSVSELKR